MLNDQIICTACDGKGLLMDDEQWQYACTICEGEGVIDLKKGRDLKPDFDIDEMNRTLE